jgi:hypothetical protein
MDFLLPWLLADFPITRADMASLGEGGFLDAGRRMPEKTMKEKGIR